MAAPDNNRKPLPRVGNSQRELQKAAYEANKKIQANKQSIEQVNSKADQANQNTVTNKNEINNIKRKFKKTEGEVSKLNNDVAQLKSDVQATDAKAERALNDAKANAQRLSNLQSQQAKTPVSNPVSSIQRNFAPSAAFTSTVSNLKSNLNTSLLNFTDSNTQQDVRLQNIEESVSNLGLQVNIFKADFQKSFEVLVADNKADKTSILTLATNVEELKLNELDEERAREKKLRLDSADKRREIKENLLEGVGKSLSKVGSGLSNTANKLLGGFNLIEAIKGLLAKLALGFLVIKFPEIYKNIQDNIGKWKRVSALFIKKLLRPIKKFVDLIITGVFKLGRLLFRGLNVTRKFFGKVIGFSFNLGKRVLESVGNFIGKLINLGRKAGLFGARTGASVASEAVTQGGKQAGAQVGSEVVKPNLLGRIASFVGDTASSLGRQAYSGAKFIDGKLTGGTVTSGLENTISGAKKTFSSLFKSLKSKFAPVSNTIKSFKGGFEAAFKEGPQALQEFFGKAVSKASGTFNSAKKLIDPLLSQIGPLARFLGNIPGGSKFLRNFVGGAGRTNPLTTFPIDYLLNHYVMGQNPNEAFTRAVGSTLGSVVGGGFGALAGGGTPLSAALAPVGSFIGGELGDWLTAKTFNYGTDDTSISLVSGLLPAIGDWFSGSNSSNDSDTSTSSTMNKLSIGGQLNGNPLSSTSSSPSPSISGSAASQALSTTPVSQVLRRPSATTTTSSSSSGSGAVGSSFSSMTLPTKTVDMPTQTVGGQKLDKKNAQPTPSFSASNPSMDYLQIAAAEQFEMQLV